MFKNIIKIVSFVLFSLFATVANTKQTDIYQLSNISKTEYNVVRDWVLDNRCKNAKGDVDKLIQLVYIHSREHKLDPHLVLGQIKQESCFDTNAKSFANAKGYMQVIAKWHPDEVKGRNLNNEYVGIEVGISVLNKFITNANGNLSRALDRYSGGATNYYNKVVRNKTDLKRKVELAKQYERLNEKTIFLASERKTVDQQFVSYSEKQDILSMFQHLDDKSKTKADALELLIRSKLKIV